MVICYYCESISLTLSTEIESFFEISSTDKPSSLHIITLPRNSPSCCPCRYPLLYNPFSLAIESLLASHCIQIFSPSLSYAMVLTHSLIASLFCANIRIFSQLSSLIKLLSSSPKYEQLYCKG